MYSGLQMGHIITNINCIVLRNPHAQRWFANHAIHTKHRLLLQLSNGWFQGRRLSPSIPIRHIWEQQMRICVSVRCVVCIFVEASMCFSIPPTASSWWQYRALPHTDIHTSSLWISVSHRNRCVFSWTRLTWEVLDQCLVLMLNSCLHKRSIRHVWPLHTFHTLPLTQMLRQMCD